MPHNRVNPYLAFLNQEMELCRYSRRFGSMRFDEQTTHA
jgi:hypothetical protein